MSRILKISAGLKRPYPIVKGNCYEVDELFTYVGHKKNRICICYSLEPKSGAIIDVVVGRRNKTTLRTHLKRLNCRTIAYSKSMAMLLAVVRIYFWC